MAKPKEDLTGLKVKTWIINEYLEKGKWDCICSICGEHRIFRAYHLKDNRVQECTHNGTSRPKIDLLGKTFGELTVLEYLGSGKWKCRCSCGKIIEHTTYELNKRGVKSCGHNTGTFKDITGQIFGELKAIRYIDDIKKWECRCSCGAITYARGTDLRSGNSKSCGHTRAISRTIDLSNKQINEWKVLNYIGNSYWECQCSCGNIVNVHSYNLRNNKSKHCMNPIHKIKDISGIKFGELTVEKYIGDGVWLCKCSCGNRKNILGANLRNGSTKSCGCKTDELLRKTLYELYGDVSTVRTLNPRSEAQQKILYDKTLFEALLVNFMHTNNRMVTYRELADILGVESATASSYTKKYELENLIKRGGNISSYEYELQTLLGKNNHIVHNSKKILNNGEELDIYIPDKKIAIEFNGNYWHSTLYKDANYHKEKTLECQRLNIRLIHIFEYEWNKNKNKIVEYLLNICDNNSNIQINARDCEVREVNQSLYELFCDQYHLQGPANAPIIYGLYNNNELLQLMSFGRPRFNKNYQYELIRLCIKDGYRITGGSERLFKHFINEYNPTSVISYCDIAKFTGAVYGRLGFSLKEYSEPGYVWVEPSNNTIMKRYQTQKHKLLELGLGTEEQTENEIMESIGFLKIYNCGNAVYTWTR